jgi:hypothetical protein
MVEVFSSLQWPFRFNASQTTWSSLPNVIASASVPQLVARSGFACNANAVDAACEQVWLGQLVPTAQACKLDGVYELQFGLECRPPRDADCPIDANTRTARFRFSLASSSFCASVVDQIGLSASIGTFADGGDLASAKDDFLDTQVVHARVAVRADKASLSRSVLVELSVQKLSAGSVVVKTLDLMDGGVLTGVGSALELATTAGGAARVGEDSVVKFSFRLRTNAANLDLAQDAIETAQLVATVRVQYANAGQVVVLGGGAAGEEEEVVVRGGVRSLSAVATSISTAVAAIRATGGAREGKDETEGGASVAGAGAPGAFVAIVAVVVGLIVVAAAVATGKLRRRSRDVVASASAARLVDAGEGGESEMARVAVRGEVVVVPTGTTMEEICSAYDDAAEEGAGVERG